VSTPEALAVQPAPTPGRAAWLALTRWAPAVLGLGAVLLAETVRGGPLGEALLYGLFLVVAIVLPGTVLWRLLGVRSRSYLEDVALGTALGGAVEVTLMWVLGFVGLQRFAILWAVAVLIVSLLPRFRGVWTRRAPATPRPVAWSIAAAVVLCAGWVWREGFSANRIAPLPGSPRQWYIASPYVDAYYHQGLASAVTRSPLLDPFVPGSPLRYALMPYEHMADVHQWTGVDLTLIVTRLYPLPLVVLMLALTAVLAGRLTHSVPARVLAPLFATLTTVVSPYAFNPAGFSGTSSVGSHYAGSPTLAMAVPMLLAAITFMVMVLSGQTARYALLAPLVVTAFAAQGSKGTPLPMLLGGLAFALVIGLFHRSEVRWRRLGLITAAVAVAFAASYWLMYGGSSRDMTLGSGKFTLRSSAVSLLGPMDGVGAWAAGIAIFVGAWVVSAAPILVMTVRRHLGTRLVVIVGTCAAGLGAGLLGVAAGHSQAYFFFTLWPLAATLGAVSADRLCRAAVGRRRPVLLAALLATGLVVTVGVRYALGWKPAGTVSHAVAVWTLLRPWLGLAVVLAVIAVVVVRLAGGRGRPLRARLGAVVAVLLVLVEGATGADAVRADSALTTPLMVSPAFSAWETPTSPVVPADGAAAARWLRDHSNPGDVVVTNMHCLAPASAGTCDARHFWLAGLTERRVLLEGWKYAHEAFIKAPAGYMYYGPYWDQAFYDANDAAIRTPGPETQAWLARQGVTWIVVDRGVFPEGGALADQATLAFEQGDFAVYRVR